MSDPTTPKGRAEIKARAKIAEQSRIYIDELTFHGGEPPILAWQQIAESQADVPALLDALDTWDKVALAQARLKVSKVDQVLAKLAEAEERAEAAEAALDRVREVIDESRNGAVFVPGAHSKSHSAARAVQAVRAALDGGQ